MSTVVSGGTVTGPHHEHRGEDNQDAFAVLQENGFTVIAAADGAGSLALSGIGASIAASTAVNEAMDCLTAGCGAPEAVENAITCAREALRSRPDVDQLGCTLAVAVLTGSDWATGVVGDAFTVVSHDATTHEFIAPERESEYANITKLLTSKSITPRYASGQGNPVAVAVASDGLLSTSVKGGEASEGFWNPLIARATNGVMDAQAFLYYMRANEKLDDDATLVIAARVVDAESDHAPQSGESVSAIPTAPEELSTLIEQ